MCNLMFVYSPVLMFVYSPVLMFVYSSVLKTFLSRVTELGLVLRHAQRQRANSLCWRVSL